MSTLDPPTSLGPGPLLGVVSVALFTAAAAAAVWAVTLVF